MRTRRLLAPALAAVALTLAACGTPAPTVSPSPAPVETPSAVSPTPSPAPTPTPAPKPTTSTVKEVPSKAWRIPGKDPVAFGIAPGSRRPPVVEAYADASSVAPGQRVRLFVSTSAKHWKATAYRMGWYGGDGGASVWHSSAQPGHRQAAAKTVGTTHTPTAPWHPSLTVATTDWRPGEYLIRLDVPGHAAYVPLTVRSTSTRGTLVLLAPDTTWQAYNDWGGRNLYWGPSGKGDFTDRARAVTFDRPYVYEHGAGEYLTRMQPVVALAERLKLPLSYADDVDLERDPHLLAGAHGLISMGHDEYYSVAMRTNLEHARDAGTNLAFLGANAVFRRIRFQSTSLGPRRLEVNYKSAAEDPESRTNPALTTADWPSPPHPVPESTLTGEAYACFPGHGPLVVASPSSWLLAGTGLKRGDQLPGALGPEFDAVTPGSPSPHPLDVVLRSPARCGKYTHSDATYYSATSGAGVFDSGTMDWVAGLGGKHGSRTQKLERIITTNLLRGFASDRVGRKHPAHGS